EVKELVQPRQDRRDDEAEVQDLVSLVAGVVHRVGPVGGHWKMRMDCGHKTPFVREIQQYLLQRPCRERTVEAALACDWLSRDANGERGYVGDGRGGRLQWSRGGNGLSITARCRRNT